MVTDLRGCGNKPHRITFVQTKIRSFLNKFYSEYHIPAIYLFGAYLEFDDLQFPLSIKYFYWWYKPVVANTPMVVWHENVTAGISDILGSLAK